MKTHYTLEDKEKLAQVQGWLDQQKAEGKEMSRAVLSRKAAISGATVSQVLNGNYPSSPTSHLDKLLEAISLEDERMAGGTPGYVKGTMHKLLYVVADRTRKHRNFGVVTGYVGVGKTRTCVEYKKAHSQTLLVFSSPQMTCGVLLNKLLEQLGSPIPKGLDKKFEEVVRLIKGTNHLILVDEAENCNSMALHYLRRIRDMAEIGIVLVGTEKLQALLTPERGQFDQIRSRVAMWPKTVHHVPRDDHDEMAREALRDLGDVSDDVLDTLWAYSKGSARVLMEGLVSAIKDYLPKDKALTPASVDKIATTILFMTKGAL